MIHRLGLELIMQSEGCRLEPYQDVAGVWTVGYGATGTIHGNRISECGPITQEYAEHLLEEDLEEAEDAVDRLVEIETNELQRTALVDFVFNLGQGNLRRSTLLRKHNAGDEEGAASEFQKWRMAGGQVQPGLVRRRGRAEQLYRTGEALEEAYRQGFDDGMTHAAEEL